MSILNQLLSECIRDVDQLATAIGLNGSDKEWIRTVSEKYPICIPPYYLKLIDLSDPDDPIRKICIPGLQELSETGHEDTSGESSNTATRTLGSPFFVSSYALKIPPGPAPMISTS